MESEYVIITKDVGGVPLGCIGKIMSRGRLVGDVWNPHALKVKYHSGDTPKYFYDFYKEHHWSHRLGVNYEYCYGIDEKLGRFYNENNDQI